MTELFRLLWNNDTLYGKKPSDIAAQIEQKMNQLERERWHVISVSALPDYHNFSDDGGVKDILFLCQRSPEKPVVWHTISITADSLSMHGWATDKIMDAVKAAMQTREGMGHIVLHVVPLTDHHNWATGQGMGGLDGTKSVILCSVVR